MTYHRLFSLLMITVLAIAACRQAPPPEPTPVPVENRTAGCIDNFTEGVDYFPNKSEVTYAQGFEIEYLRYYKVITVTDPYPGATEEFQYALVQCGAPTPPGFAPEQIITVPITRIVPMSTTYVAQLAALGLVFNVVALDSTDFVNNPTLRPRIDAGEIPAIGYGPGVNIELLLDLSPDLVVTYTVGAADFDAHPALIAADIPTVLSSDWTETAPLGRAEWVKFMAAFFNQEATANQVFDSIAEQYFAAESLVADIDPAERPTVLINTPFQGTWYMPGGNSYYGRLLSDARANYPWANTPETGSLFLDFESVFDAAGEAPVWINVESAGSLVELQAQDERFAEFAAFQNGQVWANTRRQTQYGNDFYESGAMAPHEILLDIIAILYPDRLPNRQWVYYQPLN